MPNEQRSIRVPRVQTPWEPINRHQEEIDKYIHDELRRLSQTALRSTVDAPFNVTNASEDFDFDADSTTVNELADVLATLIEKLQEREVI